MQLHLLGLTRMVAASDQGRAIPTASLQAESCASTKMHRQSSKSPSLHPSLQRASSRRIERDAADANPHWQWLHGPAGQVDDSYTIFEGTSEIQRLVIARSISGIHIR
jgi:hypothetical protein